MQTTTNLTPEMIDPTNSNDKRHSHQQENKPNIQVFQNVRLINK
jgi:hypothetical protein